MNETEEYETQRTILRVQRAILGELQAIHAELTVLREHAAADKELRAIREELGAFRMRAAADAIDLENAIEYATDRLGGYQRT